MTLSEFKSSIELNEKPNVEGPYLLALWKEAKGMWNEAHHIVQNIDHPDAAWIHAYLHRKEGDEFNAKFWYNLADKKFPSQSLNDEWDEIATYFLQH